MNLLPTREVADRLGVSISTLHGWVDAERIVPAMKAPGIRGALFFDPADVERLAGELASEAEARAAELREAAAS